MSLARPALPNHPPCLFSVNKHEALTVWYSVIWLLLFEQGHFQEKLQIKNSIILLQRHFRKDSSSVMISYIVFNSPSSFFLA